MSASIRRTAKPRSSPLRQARLIADLTLLELAQRAGVSRMTVHQLERGKRTPMFSTAQRLATALGMSVDQLFSTTGGDK